LGAWPLLIAFLPWGIRLAYRQMPFQPTPFDIVMVVFLLTAWVGVGVSYDRAMSLGRYWLMLDAVLLYYALAAQPEENSWIVTGLLGTFGAMVAGYFLLTNDFVAQPAKFEGLNNTGLWLMEVRPTLGTHQLHPNVAGGIIAMLAPLMVAVGLRAWRKRRDLALLVIAELIALMGFGLLLTTSRGAWIALAGALGIWLLWAVSGMVAETLNQDLQTTIFTSILALVWLVGVIIIFSYPGGLLAFLDSLPGPANTGTRLELMQGGFDLASDFIFTGGGLGAFPALYSQYIRVVPYFFIRHVHNLFLDVVIEQGILGVLTLAVVLLGPGWLVFSKLASEERNGSDRSLLQWAALASLLVLLVHGLVEDALYGSRAVLLLLLPSGLGLGMIGSQAKDSEPKDISENILPSPDTNGGRMKGVIKLGLAAFAVVAAAILAYRYRAPLAGQWYANLGAVAMAKVDLVGWPKGEWDEGESSESLTSAVHLFRRSQVWCQDNSVAHHRLGLVAMSNRDYQAAIRHLGTALEASPNHRGIRKNLGYSFVWVGEYSRAAALLAEIPEAEAELENYVWWWKTQDQWDFSENALQMVGMLKEP